MKKHIVCFGDSNTHGYCADPKDCADGGDRFNEDERWTCLLQKKLGEGYLVLEEGLSGRTTVFPDPLHESMAGLDVIYSTLMSHEPVDLLVIMLGTNDIKERLGANAACISARGYICAPKESPWAKAARRSPGNWPLISRRWPSGRVAPFLTPRAWRNSIRSTACISAERDTLS